MDWDTLGLGSLPDALKQQILANPQWLQKQTANSQAGRLDIAEDLLPPGYEPVYYGSTRDAVDPGFSMDAPPEPVWSFAGASGPASYGGGFQYSPEYFQQAQYIPGVGLVAPSQYRSFTEDKSDLGQYLAIAGAMAGFAGAGIAGMGAAAGAEGAAGLGGLETGAGYDFGLTGMEGAETLMPPAQLPSTAGYEAMPFESASGAPATQYNLVNPEAAAAGMGLPPMPSGGGGLPSMPPGASTLANQLAKALAGSGGTGAGSGAGGALFGQGGTPGGQSYMRKARAPMTQPAFLGEQGQQPLGAMEDAMFNEASGERRDDVSNRARQMAAQIRGRPGFFGFRSG